MKLVFITLVGSLMSLLIFAGCASSPVEKTVDKELAQEAPIHQSAALVQEATVSIDTMPGLTPAQKTELTVLRDAAHAQMGVIQEDSLKIRSLLIKEVLSPVYKKSEVTLLKKKYKSNEDRRVTLVFQTINQANDILGRNPPMNTRDIKEMELREQLLRNLL